MFVENFKAELRATMSETAAVKYPKYAQGFLWYLQQRGCRIETMPGGALRDYVTWLLTPEGNVRLPGPATVRQVVAGIRSYLDFLKGQNIRVPEQARPKLPRLPHVLPTAFGRAQLDAYVRTALNSNEPYGTALLILPFCGLRVGEVCKLRLTDIRYRDVAPDDRRFMFFIHRAKNQRQRIAPMFTGPRCLVSRAFDHYLTTIRPEIDNDRNLPPDQRWLFPGTFRFGVPQSIWRARLEAYIARYFRETTGMPDLHPHTCRSHYATALLSLSRNMRVDGIEAARYLGHTNSVRTLAEHYASVMLQDVEDWMGEITRPSQDDYRWLQAK